MLQEATVMMTVQKAVTARRQAVQRERQTVKRAWRVRTPTAKQQEEAASAGALQPAAAMPGRLRST